MSILAIIVGEDPVGEQVYLHGKPHHTTKRPLQEPSEWLQCLQQFYVVYTAVGADQMHFCKGGKS
jgi:hypothetical protein